MTEVECAAALYIKPICTLYGEYDFSTKMTLSGHHMALCITTAFPTLFPSTDVPSITPSFPPSISPTIPPTPICPTVSPSFVPSLAPQNATELVITEENKWERFPHGFSWIIIWSFLLCLFCTVYWIFYLFCYEPPTTPSKKEMEEVLPSSPIMASSVRQTLGESLGLGKKDVNFVSFKKEQDKATTYYDLHFEVDRNVTELQPRDIPEDFWETAGGPTPGGDEDVIMPTVQVESNEIEMARLDDADDSEIKGDSSGLDYSSTEEIAGEDLSEAESDEEWLGTAGAMVKSHSIPGSVDGSELTNSEIAEEKAGIIIPSK